MNVNSSSNRGEAILAALKTQFPGAVLDEERQTPEQVTITVKINLLPDVVQYLYYQHDGWLPVLFGNDERTLNGHYAVYYALSMEGAEKCWIVVKALVDADPGIAACAQPVLLGTQDPDGSALVHEMEVFGPVATLIPYRDLEHALALAHRGQGSLVCSIYGDDNDALAAAASDLAASHGRVHVVTPDVAKLHTGHGNVMPQSLHGGPGRAGGGAELGGLRALDFYHCKSAMQAAPSVLQALGATTGV